jgi:hypothetical protein
MHKLHKLQENFCQKDGKPLRNQYLYAIILFARFATKRTGGVQDAQV